MLIFAAEKAWLRIESAGRGIANILIVSILPLLLFTSAVEGYALTRWGDARGQFDAVLKLDPETVIRFEIVQIALSLIFIFLGAKFLHWIVGGFTLEAAYSDCFRLAAYSATPIFLVRLLDAIPALNTWICWTIGALLVLHVLYQGIAFVLKPSPTKGFGLYLVSSLALLALSAIAHALAFASLRNELLGRF